MAELTINMLIKIIIGIVVFVVVVLGVYLFFKDKVIDFFKGLNGAKEQVEAFLILVL